MISGTAALVYNGMSVFENDVNSEDSNILIVNRTNYEDTNCHFNTSLSLYSGSGEKQLELYWDTAAIRRIILSWLRVVLRCVTVRK